HDRVLHGRRLDGRVRLRDPGGKGGDRARGRSARAVEGRLPDQWRPRGGTSAHQYRLRGCREESLVRVTTRLVLAIWVTALAVAVVLDASYLAEAEQALWRENGIRFLVLGAVLSLIALLVVRMSITGPLAKITRWTKAVRRGQHLEPMKLGDPSLFGPITREVSVLARSLQRARAAAEQEAALRLQGETLW